MLPYASSADQLWAWLEALGARASRLLSGQPGGPWVTPEDDRQREHAALVSGVELRLPRLRDACELEGLAFSALVGLVAVDIDPAMRTFVRSLQRDAGRPFIELGLLAELLDVPPRDFPELAACFDAGGALGRHALCTVEDEDVPRVARKIRAAPRVVDFLLGRDRLPEGFKLLDEPRPTLDQSLIPAEIKAQLVASVERALAGGTPLLVELSGPSGVGKSFAAEGVAAAVGRRLLLVDLAGVAAAELPGRLAEARREALLSEAMLCLEHWQSLYAAPPPSRSHEEPGVAPVRRLPPVLEHFLEKQGGVLLLTGDEPESLLDRLSPPTLHAAVPFPTPSQRAALLDAELSAGGASLAAEVDAHGIARRFALDPRRIRAATHVAIAAAAHRDVKELGDDDLTAACRSQLRHDLTSLAERVTTSYAWKDSVIPVDVYHGLCEMVAHMRHARQVFEEWELGPRHGLSQGLSALFAGPPGTGKTMCASVMARELDMELFRIDLSRVVSKWIGETEKNLSRLFDEAQRSNAIILFDEADSLFAKRTAVKSSVDRYANLEVNYLLQRMEAFSGVTILTTNFEDTIDTAFKRRLTFRLRFERPDAAARAHLWQKVFPPACAVNADFDPVALGRPFELSGGSIRNAAVRAAFLAAEAGRAVSQRDCEQAAAREAQEMGLLAHDSFERAPKAVERRIEPATYERGESATQEKAATQGRGEPATQERGEMIQAAGGGGALPKLVPITHPRYR